MEAALVVAAVMQGIAIGYGLYLLSRQLTAAAAWLWLLGGMASMLTWRLVVLLHATPPAYFNPIIAIWGSTCMLAAMFLFGREIERRRKAEAERDALLDSERAARQAADRASRLKDEFLAMLSHELRTPLAAILGWCAIVRRRSGERLASDMAQAVETIERNARAQARLVDDMLDMTRLQAGSLHIDREAMPIDVPVRAALQAVRPSAEAKGIDLEFVCVDTPLIDGDAHRVQQIVNNLLVNAVKFTPPGGRIRTSVEVANGAAVLRVTDTGEGIAPDVLPHIFEPFRQGDSSVARRHEGLGLGLSIVARLARLHGGEVRAESAGPGRGSTFTVLMPLAADSAIPAVRQKEDDESLDGMRVLLVDDEPDMRDVVARILEQAGAKVSAVATGADIERDLLSFKPDALLIDIGMPGEDGYSLIRRIRKLPSAAGGQTPAISLTAHARAEDRARALGAGFQDHLPKPVDLARLASSLKRHVRARGDDADVQPSGALSAVS